MRADGIGDIRGCEVSVVLFSHAGISMAELRGDDAHRYATHGERRSVGMSENVKADGGGNPGARACLCKRSLLVRGAPRPAIAAIEYVSFAHAPGCEGVEQNTSFICQHNMSHFSRL